MNPSVQTMRDALTFILEEIQRLNSLGKTRELHDVAEMALENLDQITLDEKEC